jgi:two-component system, chemotaxis family, chemotaxis protein CheY
MRVLVVDDQATMRRMVVNMLHKCGLGDCHEAASGEEALLLLNTIEFDLIMTDWSMTGMTGLEFLRRVRAREATKNTPVIMVTTHDGDDEVRGALNAGVTDYLVKPFKAAAMLARVNAVLHRTA